MNYAFPRALLRTSLRQGRQPAVIVLPGSFSPVTNLHLRGLCEARDHLHLNTGYDVVGGYLTPVSLAYGKASLIATQHRVEMCKLAVQSTDWIMTDEWESLQDDVYYTTRKVLSHFHENLNGPDGQGMWFTNAGSSSPYVIVADAQG